MNLAVFPPPKPNTPAAALAMKADMCAAQMTGLMKNLVIGYRLIQRIINADTLPADQPALMAELAARGFPADDIQTVAVLTKAFVNAIKPGTIEDTVPVATITIPGSK